MGSLSAFSIVVDVWASCFLECPQQPDFFSTLGGGVAETAEDSGWAGLLKNSIAFKSSRRIWKNSANQVRVFCQNVSGGAFFF